MPDQPPDHFNYAERWFVPAHRKVMSIRPNERDRYVEVVPASEFDRLLQVLRHVALNDNVEASKALARGALSRYRDALERIAATPGPHGALQMKRHAREALAASDESQVSSEEGQ
jgi:hypothetical protein